jgi:hypothetical protein
MEIKEIRDFKNYMVNTRHSERVNRQKTTQEFFEDTYVVPYVKSEYQMRTFSVSEMANGITQQAISSQPKVFTKPRKATKDVEDGADRIAEVTNKWTRILARQSNNPFKQTFKNLAFTRGESWIYTPHKTELALSSGSWQEEMPDTIPVHFIFYDPMVVFADPSEFVDGKPTRIVVFYRRFVSDIKSNYPQFVGKGIKKDGDLVDFLFYVDKDTMYAEADEESLFRDINGKLANEDGRRSNIYGLIPFAHAYSGWGQETEDRRPELLTYERIRMLQDKIVQNSVMDSAFSYNIINFAWRGRTLINHSGIDISADAYKEYHPNEPGKLSELTLPPGADIAVEESQLFEAPVFAYRNQVKSDLESAYPSALKGITSGSSGRQEDILAGNGMALYDSPIENNAMLWATAFDNALKICANLTDKGVDMLPPGIKKDDINSYSEIEVKVKADNPLEALRKAADGDRKYQLGIIDALTNLVDFQGYTKSEAKLIMARQLVDDVTRNDPNFKQIMGMTLAQEEGILDQYSQLGQQQTGMNPVPQFGSQGGQPREGNIQTPTGREMPDMSMQRNPRRMPAMPQGV